MRAMIGLTLLIGSLGFSVATSNRVLAHESSSRQIFNQIHSQTTTVMPQS